jgi:hypothetical protein
MKTTVNVHTFREAFNRMGRGDQFSYQGLEVLFDYLTELEHCEEEYELDVIGLCCDFAEADAQTIADDYRIDLSELEGLDEDEKEGALKSIVIEYLEDEGVLVGDTIQTIVYRQF